MTTSQIQILIHIMVVVTGIVSLYFILSWWEKVKLTVEEEEFVKAIFRYTHRPSSPCPICSDEMDMQKTQKVMFVNGNPVVCCVKHTTREMTDYMKAHERS